ncbi:hypothetical protein LTR56_001454 [Elasticomyces elasticus]|nr:hypothetical protein LTR56_001454 [Elasticomyces elasticus]KAK3668623.1 hypothetical protein LTR22_000510 [Elasticomyces elasticus]KAK4931975.1 hypothetical protein LTR49_001662 [Elasticomyces elasticus]KAK5768493.1 hypothetical protein LTS12_001281 [Elasticomyces elasticus]
MFLDSFINYLKPSNASRITGLSIHDPFAIAGFIMLLFLIPIALILLTITARRSAESIWDGLTIDARFRDLRRSARRSMADPNFPPRSATRQSYRSNRATRGTQRVSFMLPGIPESPRTPRTPGSTAPQRITQTVSTPRTPATPCTPSTPHTPGQMQDTTPFLDHHQSPPPPTDRPRVFVKPTPRLSDLPLRANYDFTDVYERHRATQQPPRLGVWPEEDESKRRWTSEFQDELRMTAREMV